MDKFYIYVIAIALVLIGFYFFVYVPSRRFSGHELIDQLRKENGTSSTVKPIGALGQVN